LRLEEREGTSNTDIIGQGVARMSGTTVVEMVFLDFSLMYLV